MRTKTASAVMILALLAVMSLSFTGTSNAAKIESDKCRAYGTNIKASLNQIKGAKRDVAKGAKQLKKALRKKQITKRDYRHAIKNDKKWLKSIQRTYSKEAKRWTRIYRKECGRVPSRYLR